MWYNKSCMPYCEGEGGSECRRDGEGEIEGWEGAVG